MANSKPQVFKVALRGEALMDNPRWNKGTAFTAKEREDFGLTGRLPHTINTIDEQCQRAFDQLSMHESDLRKNDFMQSMRSQNWVLYYALMHRHLKELMPIIYTPTEVSDMVGVGVCGRIHLLDRQMRLRNILIFFAVLRAFTFRSRTKIIWRETSWSRLETRI